MGVHSPPPSPFRRRVPSGPKRTINALSDGLMWKDIHALFDVGLLAIGPDVVA